MKVAWNTCDKELGGEMKSVKENCLNKNWHSLSKVYVKYFSKKQASLAKFLSVRLWTK